jgi:hypothetical protein
MTIDKDKKLTIGLAFAMTFSIATWVTPEQASAQSVLDIVKPLTGLLKKDPIPVPNLNSSFGSNSMNSNTLNVCLFPCTPTPTANSSSVVVPQASSPVMPRGSISNNSTSCINGRCQMVISGSVPQNLIPQQQQQQQQRPHTPALTLPSIPISINLGI